MESSTSFPMEYGETVTITASYSPASASVDFGLIDSDGVFYPVRGSNGSINQTIRIDLRGTYTFAVRNNSSYKVSVSGFVKLTYVRFPNLMSMLRSLSALMKVIFESG